MSLVVFHCAHVLFVRFFTSGWNSSKITSLFVGVRCVLVYVRVDVPVTVVARHSVASRLFVVMNNGFVCRSMGFNYGMLLAFV